MSGARAAGLAAFALPLAAYALTLCRTVYVGDSGEMITLAHTLGVAQPTGFPLYCLLGKLCALVPFGTVAARVNALSALSTAAAGWLAYRVAARAARPELALAASLAFSLGLTAWSQATIARTYPLTLALVAAAVELALTALEKPRAALALALAGGFALGTHLLAVLALPVLGYVALRQSPRRAAAGTLLFALGLSLYAYLPLRSAATPYNAYGPLDTPGRLADYLRQKRYQTKQFSRSRENMRTFFAILARRFATDQPCAPGVLALAALGLACAWRTRRELVLFLAVPALANLFILLGYGDDQDLPFAPRYFLFVLWALSVLAALGLEELARRTRPRAVAALAALAVLAGAVANARVCDRSTTVFGRDYARALAAHLPVGSLLFLAGDAPQLMLDYLQFCENFRRDVPTGDPATFRAIAPKLAAGGWPPAGSHAAPALRQGGRGWPARPIFANFKPGGFPPGVRFPHAGLTWQISPGPLAIDRARFWAAWDLDALERDPALADYEAAALAGEVFFHRGLDQLEEDDRAGAFATFARATRVSPENRLLFYSLARVLKDAGNEPGARAHLERALALDVTAREEGEPYRLERYGELGLAPGPARSAGGAALGAPGTPSVPPAAAGASGPPAAAPGAGEASARSSSASAN